MRSTFSSGNIQEIIFENNLIAGKTNNNEIASRYFFDVNEKGFGKMRGKESYLKGISILDMQFQLEKSTQVYKDWNELSYFSIYLNIGAPQQALINNKQDVRIDSDTHNIWLFTNARDGRSFYNKDTIYRSKTIIFDDDYLLSLVNRYPDILSDIYSQYKKNKLRKWHKQDMPINKDIYQITQQINNARQMGQLASMYVEGKVLELLALQINCQSQECQNCGNFCKNTSDIERMHEAKSILLQNINTPPTAYELSRRVGVNEKKLKYGFKEVFNQTLYGCLLEYKMDKAQKLLLDTSKQITDVAYECGYDYPSHFATAFKRNFGISPVAYRKKKSMPTPQRPTSRNYNFLLK